MNITKMKNGGINHQNNKFYILKQLVFILGFSLFANQIFAQEIIPERPFHLSPKVNVVTIIDSIYERNESGFSTTRLIDTVGLMYFAPNGDVLVKYTFSNNKPTEQILFEYDKKHNILRETHRCMDRKNNSKPFIDDSLKTCFEKRFEYNNRSKVVKSQWFELDSLIEETNFEYNENNQLIKSISIHHPLKDAIQFDLKHDSVTYKYNQDTITVINWGNKKSNSYKKIKKYQNGICIYTCDYFVDNHKDYETYFSHNRDGVVIDELYVNSLPLYSDKILLRTNHVKYEFDAQNKLLSKLYLVNNKPNHIERYIYE